MTTFFLSINLKWTLPGGEAPPEQDRLNSCPSCSYLTALKMLSILNGASLSDDYGSDWQLLTS